jgi:hypothetical protein
MKDDPISSTEVQLTRWLDNTPGATPPENMDPRESARLRADAEAVAALLRKHVPTSVEPPYPDFFNSQLLKKIRDEHGHAHPAAASEAGGFWPALGAWLRSPWLAAAATAAVAVLAVTTWRPPGGGELASGTRVLSVFSPEPNATARIHTASDREAVIITLDGLEAFPSDRAVVGLFTDESRPLIAVHQP